MGFGDKIVEHRKNVKLSQDELANKMGVTRQTISNWELNITYPDVRQLFELAYYLCTDYTNLVEDCFKIDKELVKIREQVLNDISKKIDGNIFTTYFLTLRFYGIENDKLNIGCFAIQKSIIKNDYEQMLIDCFNKYSNKKIIGIKYHYDEKLLD